MTRVQLNGVDLDVVDEGSGPAVVFSHGAGSDLRYWAPQREAFAASHRVATVPMSGRTCA